MAKKASLILDTCALLWLAAGSNKLSGIALRRIDEATAIYVSAISGFEIAVKVARGKLKLPHAPNEWFHKVVTHHGIAVLPIEWEVCVAAAELPYIHDDPCDRFIIATARLNGLPVVTKDERFERYGLEVLN